MNKRLLTIFAVLSLCLSAYAQKNVTSKYLENPDFEARFAGWVNAGAFSFNISDGFTRKSNDLFMEKWVASTNRLGTNDGMYQDVLDLPVGTYTLVVAAHHVNQSNASLDCSGAYVYAGNEQTRIGKPGDYSVTFTVLGGKTRMGVKLTNANGNWFCADNFRLYQNNTNQDSIDIELDRLISNATAKLGDGSGATANELQKAIDEAKALKGNGVTGVKEAAIALERATLNYQISNPTTNYNLQVTTHPFVATGTTIALGRLTTTGTSVERGFCWSTDPNPTYLDSRSSVTYTNNGTIYQMDHLKPATIYYVRAYARNNGWQVAYGDVVKIATLPKGTVDYSYDFAGDPKQNARINSASAECVWMYNNLSNIRGFFLSVHYSYGSGAGGGTADCSYGGWMRVSQTESYQQTGTILHETNHGVGVGTTAEWYNNSNLRSATSRGNWLGPRATEVVRFFENNNTALMNGDDVHMWPYGINGAHEDAANPANYALYFANILITHALHQDGLICSSSVGFATPAYVFTQDDTTKYYIKCEKGEYGGYSGYLGLNSTGSLRSYDMTAEEVRQNDNCAWIIKYDPATSYYTFYNVAGKRYLTYQNGSIKSIKHTTASAEDKFHLMPSRQLIQVDGTSRRSFWVLTNSDHKALSGTASYSTSAKAYSVSTMAFDAQNSATSQRWVFLTGDEIDNYEAGQVKEFSTQLDDLLANIRKVVATPHVSNWKDSVKVADIDKEINGVLSSIDSAKAAYTCVAEVQDAISSLNSAFVKFLSQVTPSSKAQPIDLTFLIVNPSLATNVSGWKSSATHNYECCEYFQANFDFNQTLSLSLPAATYELTVQAFNRPGAYADVYKQWSAGTDGSKALMYVGTATAPVKNICAEHLTTSVTGAKDVATRFYIPNDMQSAHTFFSKGMYDNSLLATTTQTQALKVGLKLSGSASGYWTCFANFHLYFWGTLSDPYAVIQADVNRDGMVDTQDVLCIYDYMQNTGEISTEDVNEDGVVDTQDVLTVYEYIQNN